MRHGPTRVWAASRELAVWLAPAVAVALAQIAAQLVDFQLYDLHLRALNANSDASVVAWLTPAGMALALAGVLACLRRRDRARARRAVVAALLVGLLVVASARRGAFGGSLSLHRSTLMLAPALALLLALLLREAREVEATPRRLLQIGCALLVGSYVLHLMGGATRRRCRRRALVDVSGRIGAQGGHGGRGLADRRPRLLPSSCGRPCNRRRSARRLTATTSTSTRRA